VVPSLFLQSLGLLAWACTEVDRTARKAAVADGVDPGSSHTMGGMIWRVRITWLWRGEPASSPTLPLLRGESRSAPSSSSPSHGILHHLREGPLLLVSPIQTRETQTTRRSIPPICLLHRVAIGRPSKLLDSHRSFLTQTRFSNTSSLF